MKLIERFYEVTQGAIRVGGVDVRSMKQHELRRELGYVPQKAFLFSGTIESTIAYANERYGRRSTCGKLRILRRQQSLLPQKSKASSRR